MTACFTQWERCWRYLSPEPLLQEPTYVADMAKQGFSVPTYAYAFRGGQRPAAAIFPAGSSCAVAVLVEGPEFKWGL